MIVATALDIAAWLQQTYGVVILEIQAPTPLHILIRRKQILFYWG
jgi:hypothetical protein